MTEVIGKEIYYLKKYFIDYVDRASFDEIVEDCDDDVKEVFGKAIDLKRWYDVKIEKQIFETHMRKNGAKAIKIMAERDADSRILGIWGWFIKYLTIERIVANAQKTWDKQYSTGKVELLEKREDFFKFKISDFPYNGAFRLYHANYFRRVCELATKEKYSVNSTILDDRTTIFSLQRTTK